MELSLLARGLIHLAPYLEVGKLINCHESHLFSPKSDRGVTVLTKGMKGSTTGKTS